MTISRLLSCVKLLGNCNLQVSLCVNLLGNYNLHGPASPQDTEGLQFRGSSLVSSYRAITFCRVLLGNYNLQGFALRRAIGELQFVGSCFAPSYFVVPVLCQAAGQLQFAIFARFCCASRYWGTTICRVVEHVGHRRVSITASKHTCKTHVLLGPNKLHESTVDLS